MHPHSFFSRLFLVQFPINLYSFSSRLTKTPFNAIISCWASCCPSQKERDKRSRERQSTYLWSGSRVSCCWFSSIQPKPNQTKPNLFTTISLLVWLRLRAILVTGTIGLVPCIFVRVCVSAYALRFISFRSFMHVWCSGLTGDRAGFHWRQ